MKESALQAKIIKALTRHPKVIWVMAVTTGTVKVGKFHIKIGKYHYGGKANDGTSDLLMQLSDGRIGVIEVKLPGKEPTDVQHEFINIVTGNKGIGGWTDSVEGAIDIIDQAFRR